MSLSESIMIAMALLSSAIIAAGLFRKISIPYSVLLVIIGLALAELENLWAPMQALHEFRLSPELVFFVFLPALIFESGLSLDARRLMKDLMPILALAIPALLISTLLVGGALFFLIDLDLRVALLFGALISATDPVAVVALFKELGAPARLNVLVEGESLFNDATAIVVFGILLAMTLDGGDMGLVDVGAAIVEFLRVFIGGALVGVLIGLAISELLYRLQSPVSAILTMSIVTAYSSFILAEHYLHVSGVMATVTASLSLSIYGLTRIPTQVRPVLTETWEFIGLVANSLLFLLVGLSIDLQNLVQHAALILLAVVVVQLARAVSVYSMTPATTRLFRLPRVSMAECHIMWWGGLKGGLAIAIVLSIPETLAGRELLISLTLGVVLFTLLVNAWSIRPLMSRLGLDRLNADEESELDFAIHHASRESADLIASYNELGVVSDTIARKIRKDSTSKLGAPDRHASDQRDRRKAELAARHIEAETVEQLYRQGLISQYTLMDLRNSLQLGSDNHNGDKTPNIFQRIEMRILKSLREKNWAARLLARYQQRRLAFIIQRNIASALMARNVIQRLAQRDDLAPNARDTTLQQYEQHYAKRQQRLETLRNDFQDSFKRIEKVIFQRAALFTALATAEQDLHHGEIGVKAYNRVNERIKAKIEALDQNVASGELDVSQAIAATPLFGGLSEHALKQLARHAQSVNFLRGDIIIGEREKGDALYIVLHGQATASVGPPGAQRQLGSIEQGDFFGEMALLGEHVRTATVTANSAMTLLRLTRRDVLEAAQHNQEIQEELERASQARRNAPEATRGD
jgi:CPA1 family monovalent cation:H+ antiporter